jgi:hypothetical protein
MSTFIYHVYPETFHVKVFVGGEIKYSELGMEYSTSYRWIIGCNETTSFAVINSLIRDKWDRRYLKLAGCPLQYQCRFNVGTGTTPNYFNLMAIGDERSWKGVTKMALKRMPDVELVVTPIATIPDDDDDDFLTHEDI